MARWPLGLILIGAVVTELLRTCPRRSQPQLSWLAFGSGIAVVGWAAAVTIALGLFFRVSHLFGETYGSLAGMVALLMWAVLSSTVLIYGAAVAAQLEAVRSDEPEPQDQEKVDESEPWTRRLQCPWRRKRHRNSRKGEAIRFLAARRDGGQRRMPAPLSDDCSAPLPFGGSFQGRMGR